MVGHSGPYRLGLPGISFRMAAVPRFNIQNRCCNSLFLGMNILSGLDLIDFLNPVKPIMGVIIEGNVPLIVRRIDRRSDFKKFNKSGSGTSSRSLQVWGYSVLQQAFF
jgi:hypothetical protein